METAKKISKSQMSVRIVAYELIGFIILIVIMWLNEILDLPHILFGAPATPQNYTESIFESIIVMILCLFTIILTLSLLKKIRYLQGIIPICSYCKKVRVEEDWLPVDDYLRSHSSADLSHGLCPECLKKYYETESDKVEKNG